jgi:hypothetical protein
VLVVTAARWLNSAAGADTSAKQSLPAEGAPVPPFSMPSLRLHVARLWNMISHSPPTFEGCMSRSKLCRPAIWMVSLGLAWGTLFFPAQTYAADADAVVVSPAPRVTSKVAVDRTAPLRNKNVEYGCKRIWRCDDQVCEWRRGCWGVYGYMEAPYYSVPLARSQWQMHGWPTSSRN